MSEKNKDFLITLFLFSLAFLVRLLLISKGPFHMDTLELARAAQATLDTFKLQYMHWAGYPLAVIVASAFIFFARLVGISDPVFSVNLMSVVLGSLNIIIFYLLARKMLDRVGSLASSLIFSFLPIHISVSTFGMTHPVSIFFHLSGIYLLFLYFDGYKTNRLMLSAIFLGLGTAARLPDGIIIISVVFLYLNWLLKYSGLPKKDILHRLIIYLIIYSIAIIIFYLPMFFRTGLAQFKGIASAYYYDHSLIYLWFSLKEVTEILGFGGIVLLIFGAVYFFLDKKNTIFYFLLLLFLSIFIYYGSSSVVEHRYLLLAIVPLLIIQGYFVSKVFAMKRLRLLFTAALFIFVAVNFILIYPTIKFRHDNSLQEDFAKFVQKNIEPSSYVIAMDEGPFIEYYAKRNILYKATGIDKRDFDEFFNRIDYLLTENMPIYIISTAIYSYDPKRYFINTLSDKYNLKYIGCRINEDYHHKAIKQFLFLEALYKIEKI